MAKKIIWSLKAQVNRKGILTYWNNRNKSNTYSIKLKILFKEAVIIISKFPEVGRLTDIENVRVRLVKDYMIVYETSSNNIYILLIWDGRRNPDKFNSML